jgi:hypothetical protein
MRLIGNLGKNAALFNPNALKLRDFIAKGTVPPPYADHTRGIKSWGMMLNGPNTYGNGVPAAGLGCCVPAGVGHSEQVFSLGKYTPPDSLILSTYELWGGYVLGKTNTDNGMVEGTALDDWEKDKFGGHVLAGYANPQPQNFSEIEISISEFGGVFIGLQLPNSAMTQYQNGQIWDVVKNDGGIAGGHAVFCPAYHTNDPTANKATTITAITWGTNQKMTLAFWDKYCDESHVLLANAWQSSGLTFAALKAELASL